MSFTRFHDDPCRIEKQLQESTGPGRYSINVPGNGSAPCFMGDPFIRLDRWGANLRTNFTDIQSDLKGMTRPLNRDSITFMEKAVKSSAKNYPSCAPGTDQSRATHPAWTYRDLEQVNWYVLHEEPQKHAMISFPHNISSRIDQKNNYLSQKYIWQK